MLGVYDYTVILTYIKSDGVHRWYVIFVKWRLPDGACMSGNFRFVRYV